MTDSKSQLDNSQKPMPKVLMLTYQEIIEHQKDGGKRVSYRNYELLINAFGCENVTLMMYSNANYAPSPKNIYRIKTNRNFIDKSINLLCGRLFTFDNCEQKITDYVENNNIDVLFLDRSLYGALIDKIKSRNINCKIWVFVHNLEVEYFKNKFKKIPFLSKLIVSKIYLSEKETLTQADCIFGLTKRDSIKIEEKYGVPINYFMPTTFRDSYDIQKAKKHIVGELHLMFVGSNFGPNFDGINWFIDEVMPSFDNIDLIIVGKNFENSRKLLEKKNVQIIGTVDCLSDYYYEDNILVMPIFYGDGQKVKTAEAMMYGKVLLATDEALEGYNIDGVDGIFRCNSKEEFISQINNLIHDNDFEKYAVNVRTCFLNHYCSEKAFPNYAAILQNELEK